MKPTIYLAGPLFSSAELEYNRNLAAKLRDTGLFTIWLPQEHEQQHSPGYAKAIFESDIAALASANLVVAVLDGADVDSGTAFELGWAYATSTPIYAIRSDFRSLGPEEKVNLMVQSACSFFTNDISMLCSRLITDYSLNSKQIH